uniref:Uncharacterized protein n=1 Tax=Glossina brevipalpis TaxID=37001 RepID=A0A1A9WMB2_9MUSC
MILMKILKIKIIPVKAMRKKMKNLKLKIW